MREDFKGESKNTQTIREIFDPLTEEIHRSIRAKKPYGFPLNVSFTTLDALWEEVKSTGIHNIYSENVEFILSVGIY